MVNEVRKVFYLNEEAKKKRDLNFAKILLKWI